jgi:hypothetical protein
MYFDIERPIEADLIKMKKIITYAKEKGTIFGIDSNARSTTWNDTLTNKRGKTMDEFITSRHLHIANEESHNTTFQTSHGASNIDLSHQQHNPQINPRMGNTGSGKPFRS